MISSIQNVLLNKDTSYRNGKVIALLTKSLYLFLVLKILFLWPIINDIIANSALQFGPGIRYVIFAPLALMKIDIQFFLIAFLVVLILGLFFNPNYFSAVAIFWFSISLSKLIATVANGSDLVLNIFLFISIFLATTPKLPSGKLSQLQSLISNSALLLSQIQLALIYLLSGYDKLTSEAWQTGAAMHSIINLTFFQNPFLKFEFNEVHCTVLSWLVILFELSFSVLIWFKKFRIPMLVVGVMFHLGIVFFLGLLDFGIIMIICYVVFLPVTRTDTLRYEASLKS